MSPVLPGTTLTSTNSTREGGNASFAGDLNALENAITGANTSESHQKLDRERLRVLEMLQWNSGLEAILDEVTGIVENRLPGRVCGILLNDHDQLKLAAGRNLPQAWRDCLASGVAVHDAHKVPGNRVSVPAPGWSVPIELGPNRTLGALCTYHTQASPPTTAEIEFTQGISKLAAFVIDHRQMFQRLEKQANFDQLTGFPNRMQFETDLDAAVARADWHHQRVALLWLDIDRFKAINETLGHRIGDGQLKQIASRLSSALGGTGTLARTGGDEFGIILSGRLEDLAAERWAEKILGIVREPVLIDGYEIVNTVSIGISYYPDDAADAETLQRNAESAMYQAKTEGRDAYWCYHSLNSGTRLNRLEIESGLRHAIPNNELRLYYQPQVDLEGNLHGFEALIRWQHPKYGLLTPGDFIQLAEETGLVVPIGAWVLREACRQTMEWRRAGWKTARIAVNVSALQVYSVKFADTVRDILEETGLDPASLQLELTETLVMRNLDQALQQLRKIRDLGVSIAMDDFGSGYSSLGALQKLPIDTLKIDRSFFQQPVCESLHAVVRAVTTMAHTLGMLVVAEGIERQDQMKVLEASGVDQVQGYLIDRPLPVDDVRALFRRYERQVRRRPVNKGKATAARRREAMSA